MQGREEKLVSENIFILMDPSSVVLHIQGEEERCQRDTRLRTAGPRQGERQGGTKHGDGRTKDEL